MFEDLSPGLSAFCLALGFLLLTGGAELLLRGSVGIARRFGLSDLVIGVTLVALGTSAPELFVSVNAALGGEGEIALGNVVGSNICNILLVLGCGALFLPYIVCRRSHLPQALVSLAALLLVLVLAAVDHRLSRLDSMGLLLLLAIWVGLSLRAGRGAPPVAGHGPPPPVPAAAALALLGLVILWAGSECTVGGTVNLALWLGLEKRVVAVSVVALGTSLPELVTTFIAALRKSPDLALGNVIGSNVFNLLCILGAAGTAAPLAVAPAAVVDLLLVAGVTLFLLLPLLFCRRIGRLWGGSALLAYVAYISFLVLTGRV